MKYFGGLVVLLYSALALSGWEPFGGGSKDKVPDGARRAGVRSWTGGFMGGK